MANIIIHKGYISHGGQIYKAGEMVTIADNVYAKRMVARSGGDFDFYHGEKFSAADEDKAPSTSANKNPDADGDGESEGNVSESDNTLKDTGEADGAGLPAFDAAAAVQTAKTAKEKKK